MEMNEEDRGKLSATMRKEAEALERARLENEVPLEKAKEIKIHEDTSLPESKQVKIINLKDHIDERVKVYGWTQNIRRDGKKNYGLLM